MPDTTTQKLKLTVDFQHDPYTDSPFDDSCFTLLEAASWDSDELIALLNRLPKALKDKTWWIVSCYRHGGEHWFLKDDTPVGVDRWDTTNFAGVLYLESGDPGDIGSEPRAAAAEMLEEYNRYCSGDCWYFQIKYEVEVENEGTCPCCNSEAKWISREDVDYGTMGGIIGLEYALEVLREDLEGLEQRHPGSTDKYEVVLSGDRPAMAYSGDIERMIRVAGFRIQGDAESG